jgi:hypothetical protein
VYLPRYIQYLNLPQIPKEIFDTIPTDFSLYESKYKAKIDTYMWTDSHNQQLNEWCQTNICPDMYFAFQIITGDMGMHKDIGTRVKINYLVQTGGDNVLTEFFDDDQTTQLASYTIDAHRWHILKADTYHGVTNVAPGQVRFSITGRIF